MEERLSDLIKKKQQIPTGRLAKSLAETMQEFGFDPTAQRLNILPNPNGSINPMEWTAPQWLYDVAKAVALPGHAARGGSYTANDVTNMALSTMGAGSLGASIGGAPINSVGMNKIPFKKADILAEKLKKEFGLDDIHVAKSTNRNAQESAYVRTPVGEVRISDHMKNPDYNTSKFNFDEETPDEEISNILFDAINTINTRHNELNNITKSAYSKMTDDSWSEFKRLQRKRTPESQKLRKEKFLETYGLSEEEFKQLNLRREPLMRPIYGKNDD